jgi:hypothetical protein
MLDKPTDHQLEPEPDTVGPPEAADAALDAAAPNGALAVVPEWPQSGVVEWPWSEAAAVRRRTRAAALEASLAIAEDRLAVARRVQAAWNELAYVRASESARTAVLEARADGEAARLSAAFRRLVQMTAAFAAELSALEPFRATLGDEILDAIRERALNEFAARVAAALRGDAATGGAKRQP